MMPDRESSAAAGPSTGAWQLWRQDDNGSRVMMGAFASRADAEARQAEFEARHHKQIYWVEQRGGEVR